MSYSVKIQLCDDDSIITEIETEATNIKQGEQIIAVLARSLDSYLDDTCEQCKKLGENTCGNDMQCRCFEPKN